MKNFFRTLPAALALTGTLFWLPPAPPVEAQDICVTITVCVRVWGVNVCYTTDCL